MTASPTRPEGRIACQARGPLLLLQIDRPAKRNGFTPATYAQLAAADTRLGDDPALRVDVLHAAGEHLTAGLSLPRDSFPNGQGKRLAVGKSA